MKLNPRLSTERRNEIECLVAQLKQEGKHRELQDLKNIAENRGIRVVEDGRVIIPGVLYSPYRHQRCIITRSHLFKDLDLIALAHELGHALLDHNNATSYSRGISRAEEEVEAEYFREKLGHPRSDFKMDVDCLYTLATHPILSLKCMFSYRYNKRHMVAIAGERVFD